jgi:hypothetical protein
MRFITRLSSWGAVTLLLVLPFTGSAQWDKKPYSEWSQKETQKMLDDSPWGKTQVVTDASRMFDTGRRLDSGQSRIAETSQLNFRIRFFSAKPIRQAVSRYIELQQKDKMSDQMASQLNTLASADFPDYVIITVLFDADNATSIIERASALFNKLTTSQLKNSTYLLVKGGQRVFLQEYQAPRRDGLGARFVFPRMIDGNPLITPESGEVQFYTELGGVTTLNMRYKVKEMMHQGKLEY